MRFKQYLIEKTMTFDMALKVFGINLDQVGDKEELKKKYRQLAIQNHPDRGGSTEAMQNVNSAYDVLAKVLAKTKGVEKREYSSSQKYKMANRWTKGKKINIKV